MEATTGCRFLVEELRAVGAVVHLAEPAETAGLRSDDKTDEGQPQAAPPAQLTPPKDYGTLVNGVPLSETQRPNQPG